MQLYAGRAKRQTGTAYNTQLYEVEEMADSTKMSEKLIYEVLSAVDEIPEGKVASYGQVAKLIGRDRNARLVGKVLSLAEYYGEYPCHRVVNHVGRLAPHFIRQRELLLEEGVDFKPDGCVDMKKCRWQTEDLA